MSVRHRKNGGGESYGYVGAGRVDETRLATPPPASGHSACVTLTPSSGTPDPNRSSNSQKDGIRDRNVLMVGPNFRVGKKIGCGNFGELRLG